MPIALTPDFWDCECESNYIHRSVHPYCLKCDTFRVEQPDSRQEEVCDMNRSRPKRWSMVALRSWTWTRSSTACQPSSSVFPMTCPPRTPAIQVHNIAICPSPMGPAVEAVAVCRRVARCPFRLFARSSVIEQRRDVVEDCPKW